jgi:two-component system, NtrC family, response regulator AtoC
MAKSVLIVDDEELIRRSLRIALEGAGYAVNVARSGREALDRLSSDPPDCVVLDLRLGDIDGLEVLEQARERLAELKAIVITAHGDLESAVRALRLGAFDFIRKPFDLEEVIAAVQNALRTADLEQRVAYLGAQEKEREPAFLYESEAMKAAMDLLARIAAQPIPAVTLRGETGTGKQLAAKAFHRLSSRASGPFIELNCSTIPEQLVESELFGHERGAFSDAREQKRGLVELADGGTLFLDEVGDLPTSAQAKLLKFVESFEFRRVGGTKLLRVDCRVIAATHQPLEDSSSFRRDLFFRLSGITVTLPPLRERGDDVLLVARHLLAHFARQFRKRLDRFTPEAESLLRSHRWPGNIRELKAAVSSAAVMADGPVVGVELLGQVQRAMAADLTALPESLDAIVPIEQLEKTYVRRVVELCGGNKLLAAQRLGISRQTLARWLAHGDLEAVD